MKYAELLSSYISESKMSLSQIAEALKEKGFSSHKGYISKLQNGKLPPAGDELNKALAEVTGGDPDRLMWYAFIEKAPEPYRKILQQFGEEIIPTFKDFLDEFPGYFQGDYDPEALEQSETFKEFISHFRDVFFTSVKDPEKAIEVLSSHDRKAADHNRVPEFEEGKEVDIHLELYEIYLNQAKSIIQDTPRGDLELSTTYNALFQAVNALELRINQVVVESIVKRGLEREWADDYIEGVSLKGKLDTALKMHVGYDITSESFFPDLTKVIDLRNKIAHGRITQSEFVGRTLAMEMINTIEKAIESINNVANEKGIE